ncbi:MAG: hypothetical protein PHO28_01460 [Candidatus Pacebacteria bacterium]|nr:hypothetical protein [Candidatus Paceibacterota bacterium]
MKSEKLKLKDKNWIKNITIFLTCITVLLITIKLIYYNIDFLDKNSGVIQTITTVVLVIITGIYAYFTQRMANLMAKQVISDIKISNVVLGTPFVENWFLERLKEHPGEIKEDSYFKFKLLFDVYNKSSSSGSIEKPVLILKFANDNFEHMVSPNTKESWSEKLEESGSMTTYRTVVNDFGGAIFLNGGEFQKIELKYTLYNFSQELLAHIKKNLKFLEYFIEYSDNLENKHQFKILKIKPERDTFRK